MFTTVFLTLGVTFFTKVSLKEDVIADKQASPQIWQYSTILL